MKTVLCSSCLPEKMQKKLEESYHVVPLPPDNLLDVPVRCHPDMICAVMDGIILFPRLYAKAYPYVMDSIREHSSCEIVLTEAPRSPRYPEDTGLNAAVLPDALVCREKSTDPELLRRAGKAGRTIIRVRQGYAACSCMIAGKAVLTSDRSIYSALIQSGYDTTFAANDGIVLEGYDVGLIGGCGGVDNGKLWLFGFPDSVPCREQIAQFARQHSLELCPLADTVLCDYGGLKFL